MPLNWKSTHPRSRWRFGSPRYSASRSSRCSSTTPPTRHVASQRRCDVTDFFKYDFGYTWFWSYGHLVVAIVFVLLGVLAWRLAWPRWMWIASGCVALWGLAVFVGFDTQLSRPVVLPTPHFLESGNGRVLDGGAGSGRSTLMVLLARPH